MTTDVRQQGAMIALVPAAADAARLAMDGGEPSEQLHLALVSLGDGDDWSREQRAEMVDLLRARAVALTGPVRAQVRGVARWHPGTDDPAWVWPVGDDGNQPDDEPKLGHARRLAWDTVDVLGGQPDVPLDRSPWPAHITASYSPDPSLLPQLEDRLGSVVFDRVRVSFGDEVTDIRLGPEPAEVAAAVVPWAPDAEPRVWHTPEGSALAYEDQETGDGRLFAAGALYWESGPWPLQYADEMLSGHDGAELAGSIEEMGRDGGRITGAGVLYTHRPAGADAAALLDEGAPLGVSVDLDDVDLEVLDRTMDDSGDSASPVLTASLSSVRAMRLPDSGWHLTATAAPSITASGAAVLSSSTTAQIVTGPDGQIPRQAVAALGVALGRSVTASAGDPDPGDGAGDVVHTQRSGDTLLRITRGRVRGATLVAVPAYADARIVLAPLGDGERVTAAVAPAAMAGDLTSRVVQYVSSSPVAVGARETAAAVGITVDQARTALAHAATEGLIVRLSRGLYVGAVTALQAEDTAAEEEVEELSASAWAAMRDLPPMPAGWFREPTVEELPPGSGGVHYADGRIWGWVAQVGEPHAGHPGRNLTLESLGQIDLTYFLRARFALDDGGEARVGALTMNVGHHRDGAECETATCQFDDTRTVAGIVTVGRNERGMWFSGAAGPWLSDWDRMVFAACQPSYHMQRGRNGRWQLRAVLSVPVPGHASPLLASAVAERAQLALTAAAAVNGQPDAGEDTEPDTGEEVPSGVAALAATDTAPDTPDTTVTSEDTHTDTSTDTITDAGADTGGHFADALQDVLATPAALDAIAAALEQRATERDAAIQDEIDQLSRAIQQPALSR